MSAPVRSEPRRSPAPAGSGCGGTHEVAFDPDDDLVLHRRRSLPFHPNGMTFTAYARRRGPLGERTYYSIGGGFVLDDDGSGQPALQPDPTPVPWPVPDRDRAAADLHATRASRSAR